MRSLSDAARVAELDGRIGTLTAAGPGLWGVMTAHQMVTHLRDSMRGAAQVLPLARVRSPLSNPVARYLALRSGIPWRRNFATVKELDLRGKPLPDAACFEEDLRALRAQLVEFAEIEAAGLSPQHPMFGPMTREDWMCWAYLHADHHLRQFGC